MGWAVICTMNGVLPCTETKSQQRARGSFAGGPCMVRPRRLQGRLVADFTALMDFQVCVTFSQRLCVWQDFDNLLILCFIVQFCLMFHITLFFWFLSGQAMTPLRIVVVNGREHQ